jgi:Ca-activated chloride channel family protein
LLLRSLAPWIAVAVALVAAAVFARFTGRALLKRPVLLALAILGGLLPLYLALAWTGLVPETFLRVGRPLVAIATALAALFVARRLAVDPTAARKGRARLLLSDLFTAGALLAAGGAAAGVEIGRPLDRMTVLVAVDRSRSVDLVPHAETRIARELRAAETSMRADDRIGVIVFGATATVEDPPRPRSDLPPPQRVSVGRDGSDLGAAIRRALAEVPADSAARIALISDGVATRGDALGAAAAALAADVPVDVVALEQEMLPDVRVVALRAPPRADAGEAIDLRLVTHAPRDVDVEIRVKRDGVLVSQGRARLSKGEDVLKIREKAEDAGLHRWDVAITALDPDADGAPEDNEGTAFVRVRGQARALVLEGDAGKSAFVAASLREASFLVDEGNATRFPQDLGGFAAYDLVVLSDIPAHAVSPTQLDALGSYVRDLGGGLILLGGDRSMGPGGYARTPVEEISPVSFDLKQEKRRASLAEVIAIDISGSMGAEVGGKTKLELANEAAARSAELLGGGDLLGVEHVDTQVFWSVKLGPVSDKKAIDKAIRAVQPGGGGIFVDIALAAAYGELARAPVNLKHVLLFSDGDDADQIQGQNAVVADAMRKGITTSVIALGTGKDVVALEELSRVGGGRYYLIEDAARLPAVFAQETILAARSALVEKPFNAEPAVRGAPIAGIAWSTAPTLQGYVVTIPKGRASVHLTGIDGDPVLATWAAGLGRTAAFTSDLKDRWGSAWTSWPGASQMLGQTARDVSRKDEDRRVRLEADAAGGQLHVRATVVGDDGRAHSFRRLVAKIGGPDGFSQEVPLEATGAGAYATTVPLSRPGTYVVAARDELTGELVGTTGAALGAGEELRPTGSDLALLGRIADLSGGKRRDTLAGIFADRATRRFAYDDPSRELALAAALLLLSAVAARRLAMPEALSRALARMAAARRAPVPATAGAVADGGTLDHLLARTRSGERTPSPPVVTPAAPGVTPAPPPGVTAPAAGAPTGRTMTDLAAARGRSRLMGSHPIAQASLPRVPPVAARRPSTPPPTASASPAAAGSDPSATPASRRGGATAAEILLAKRRGSGRAK